MVVLEKLGVRLYIKQMEYLPRQDGTVPFHFLPSQYSILLPSIGTPSSHWYLEHTQVDKAVTFHYQLTCTQLPPPPVLPHQMEYPPYPPPHKLPLKDKSHPNLQDLLHLHSLAQTGSCPTLHLSPMQWLIFSPTSLNPLKQLNLTADCLDPLIGMFLPFSTRGRAGQDPMAKGEHYNDYKHHHPTTHLHTREYFHSKFQPDT